MSILKKGLAATTLTLATLALTTIFALQPVHATDSGTTQSNLSSSQ